MSDTIPVPLLKLNNGIQIPALGFGTFAKEGVEGKCRDAVLWALEAGYRHLDCAWYYKNEDEVGTALHQFLASNPSVQRSDIFITTKVWPHLCGTPEDVEWSLMNSLERLKLDYVDAFLIHWPFAAERTDDREVKLGDNGKYIINESVTANFEPIWRKVESLYKAGKAKSIGVSNYTIQHLETLLSYAEIPPAMNQVEIHPFFPNTKLIDYCKSKDILPVAYSPLGSQNQVPTTGERVITSPALLSIAEKKGVTLAQICISWGVKRGYVVLPKSGDKERIKTNGTLVDLTEEEMENVNNVAKGRETRFVDLRDFFGLNVFGDE